MDIEETKKQYSKARVQAEQFGPIFRQYQKLAENIVEKRSGTNPFPYGEGTAASVIGKMPQRVLRQVPLGMITNISDEFMATVCEFIVSEIFARNARKKAGLIQTLWNIMEDGATFGFCTVTTFFTKVNGAYTVDFRPHYWADVMPCPGVKNMNEGDVFIRDWWSREDLDEILLLAEEDDSINADAVKELLDAEPGSRDSQNQSEVNKRASVSNLGYEVIRYYATEKGKHKLYIFRDGGTEFIQEKEIPTRGHVTFYYNPDKETAYGRSVLSLIGGTQIDMDLAQQGKRKARELEIDPMLIVKGWTLSDVKVKPKTLIKMPPESSIEPFSLSTPSLDHYTQDHAADQALIYQLAGYHNSDVPGDVSGSTAIGKTPQALRQSQSQSDNDDNKVSSNLKLFLQNLFSDSLIVYFDALPDRFLVELNQEYTEKIMSINPERFVAPGVVIVDNRLDLFDYEVNIESGKDDVDAQKLDSIMKTLGLLEQSPLLSQRVATLGIADDLIKEIIFASGLNNDSIAKKLSFLDNPNMGANGQPGGDATAGRPIPPAMAAQMAQPQTQQSHNPVVQTQAPNPVRQQGVM